MTESPSSLQETGYVTRRIGRQRFSFESAQIYTVETHEEKFADEYPAMEILASSNLLNLYHCPGTFGIDIDTFQVVPRKIRLQGRR